MADVQSIGAVDYNQFQPSQIQQEQYQTLPPEAMSDMPEVYDEAAEAKRSAGLGMVGATILGVTMLVVGGLIGKHMGSKGLESAEKALKEAKTAAEEAKQAAEKAVKQYEKMQEANAEIEKELQQNNQKGFLGRFMGFQKMKDRIMSLIKQFKKEAPKAEETVAKETEGTAKKAEDAVKKD